MEKVLFLDRDGTLIIEPPDNYQVDSLEKLEFLPGVFRNLYLIRKNLDYELVIVSNQDGLGTSSYPEETWNLVQGKIIRAFLNEGVEFDDVLIDRSLPEDNLDTRKPLTGLLTKYLTGNYDVVNSYVIGDRFTDIKLAKNIGAKAIFLGDKDKVQDLTEEGLSDHCTLIADNWDDIYAFLRKVERQATVIRKTRETTVKVQLSLDGSGKNNISTGLGFLDHMLEQIATHSGCDLDIQVKGDLNVDEHHTIEDTALALGEAFLKALGDKKGIGRFGFTVPMDDSLASIAIDFGGRPWIEWNAEFKRNKVGDVPTEMFFHFFKSFSDEAKCNINIMAGGTNEHHKIEAIFKAFARALGIAIKLDPDKDFVPSSKGSI